LSKNNGSSSDPQIAVYGNSTYVVWKDNSKGNDEIYLKLSTAGKDRFGKLINLSKNNGSSSDPQIAVYGNSTYVVWKDNSTGNDEIYLKLGTAGNDKFGRLINLSHNNGSSVDPNIGIDEPEENVYVIWEDSTEGLPELQFKASLDGKFR
jgi:hypothetical protein